MAGLKLRALSLASKLSPTPDPTLPLAAISKQHPAEHSGYETVGAPLQRAVPCGDQQYHSAVWLLITKIKQCWLIIPHAQASIGTSYLWDGVVFFPTTGSVLHFERLQPLHRLRKDGHAPISRNWTWSRCPIGLENGFIYSSGLDLTLNVKFRLFTTGLGMEPRRQL